MQFVTLYRGGEKVQMSTRSGEFVTLRELRDEVGNDAARFFYVMRSNDQHLDFDMRAGASRTRTTIRSTTSSTRTRASCSVLRQMREKGFEYDAARGPRVTVAAQRAARTGAAGLAQPLSGNRSRQSALQRAPHTLVHYLRELATDFHAYYNAHTVPRRGRGRAQCAAVLIQGLRQVVANGLGLLGVSAPETM